MPFRAGREKHNRIPKWAFAGRHCGPPRQPLAERGVFWQRRQCLVRVFVKMLLDECVSHAPFRVVEMAGATGGKIPRHAGRLALVIRGQHWEPDEVNARVVTSTGLDDFFLHRTGAIKASPSGWREQSQDAQLVLVSVELLTQRLNVVTEDGHSRRSLTEGISSPG